MLSRTKKAAALYFEPLKKLLAAVRSVVQFRVKRWHVAMRGWNEKDVRVLICLEDSIWYWVVLEWLFWDVQTHVCHCMDCVKLPKFVRNWKRHWDKDDPEYFATWEDWYGDSFHSIWHCHVCDPLLQWVWRHKDFHKAWPQWELTFDEARKTFAHDPKIYEWAEKELAEHKQYDAEKLDEIRKSYKAGGLTREQALEKLGWHFGGENLEILLDEKEGLTVS